LTGLLRRIGGGETAAEAGLFGEGPGGVVVAGPGEAVARLAAAEGRDRYVVLGETGGETLIIATGPTARLEVEVAAAREAFERGVADHFS
ncbi:MAG: hypothetical protein M3088_05795, partial [Actinomycetota bacterium]|nr:hypothetical protein [Actinomycetota bacterium]